MLRHLHNGHFTQTTTSDETTAIIALAGILLVAPENRCLLAFIYRFHTFRHFKATMEHNKTKRIVYVMKLLRHKSIANTLICAQLIDFKEDEYHSAIATTIEQAQNLIDSGYDFIHEHEGKMLFRKRK